MQSDRIDRRVDVAAREQRGQGRGKAQPPRRLAVVQRLDAETVARQRDSSRVALVDREGEHAVEALDALRAPGMEALQRDFGVAVGEEAIAACRQLLAQRAVVVQTAVERDRQSERRVAHRLLRMLGQVDDAQPSMREGDVALLERTCAIGAACTHRRAHAHDRFDVGSREGENAGGGRLESGFARESAHGRNLAGRSRRRAAVSGPARAETALARFGAGAQTRTADLLITNW